MKRIASLLVLVLICSMETWAQKSDIITKEVILKRETSGFIDFRSNGWGLGYRYSKFKTGYSMKSWDFSFSVVKDLQQIKSSFQFNDLSGRIYYGKLIHFYNIKILRGNQKVITTKPYWGGVEFRRLFYSGINLGVGVPIWVYIYNYNDGSNDLLVKYDPYLHDRQDIRAKGPFVKGLNDMKIYPALSFKYAINTEYGTLSQVTKGIEIGIQADIYPIPVQIMAFDKPSYALFSIYLGFHFGKRYNP